MSSENESFIPSEINPLNMTYEEILNDIKDNYNNINHPIGFRSPSFIKKFYKIIPLSRIIKILSTFESFSLMQNSHNPKKFNPFISFHLRDVFQCDVIHIDEISSSNDGVKYIHCCVDTFSKRLWAVPLINIKAHSIIQAFKIIFSSIHTLPKSILTDGGKEYNNKDLHSFLRNLNIQYFVSQSEFKCSGVERVQYTLQRKIYSFITERESLRYIDSLQNMVQQYQYRDS